MCLDISFRIDISEDSLYDYLPHLKIDPQIGLKFENNSHIQAHARPHTRIIYTNTENIPYMTLMRWGVLTKFMLKNSFNFFKYGNNMYNARAENIFDPKSTWFKIKQNRCLIATDGIYEHRKIIGWKNKVPYFIRLASKKPMLIPALYNYLDITAEDIAAIKATGDNKFLEAINKIINIETGELLGTHAMITRAANEKMQMIHNDGDNKHRMPLFMEPEMAVKWIDPNLTDNEMKEMLAFQIPSESLLETPVYTIRSQNPRPDSLLKHEQYNWPNLPPLGNDYPLEPQAALF